MDKKCVEGYIERAITDIARKCNCATDDVILVMSEFVPCDLKATCETHSEEQSDEWVPICWPEIQEYMDKEGFEDNASLINDEFMLPYYGPSSYFVCKKWMDTVK